jgi:1-acyl-sn-glycerol-3-phosphate acyltransferase
MNNNYKMPLCHRSPDILRAHRPAWLRQSCEALLRRRGWSLVGEIPRQQKLILVLGPHTSNWDFFVGITAMLALDLDLHWLGKHLLFKRPVRRLFTWLGGIPVDRANPAGFAEGIAVSIRQKNRMVLVITPEGTRSKVSQLKTGFSRIARQVPCPILPVTLDFAKKEIRLFSLMQASEFPEADAGAVREIFATAAPKRPENF